MTLRCVIVDDNPEFLRTAQELLEGEGVMVVGTAAGADDALRLMREFGPDVILIDIDLGSESGFELARLIEAKGEPHTPSILVSAYQESDYRTLIETSPAIGFMSKADLSASRILELMASR